MEPALAFGAASRPVTFFRGNLFFLLLLSLICGSCAVTDFVGAYFNTYYNARRVFDDAEIELLSQADLRPGGRNYLAPFNIAQGTRAKLTSVIEKCSKLLQYHGESSLVDDALMMIGKAYYYQDDDQQALRKYHELIDGYPRSSLKLEAEVYLAYVRYRLNDKPGARETARQTAEEAEKEGESGLLARACSVLGQLALDEKDYAAARTFFERAGENGDTPLERSGSFMAAADMCSRMGNYPDAEAAYRRAQKETDTYAGEYRGRLGAIRMKAKQKDFDGALRGLYELRASSNNREFFGEIELEIGHVLRDMGDIDAALSQYAAVDTLYPRTESSANSYFARGTLFETVLFRYDSARVAYGRARLEYAQAAVTLTAGFKADYLNRYFQYTQEITRYDSIRAAILAPDSVTAPAAHADTAGAPASGKDTVRAVVRVRPAIPMDTVEVRLATNKSELAGLFFATIGLPDSAEKWYRRVVEEHPHSPYVPRALFTLAQLYGKDSAAAGPRSDSLYKVIVERFPDSEFAVESRRLLGLPPVKRTRDVVGDSYSRGENLMMSGSAEAAVDTFRLIARAYPASNWSSRALYAAGWLYENRLANQDSAIAQYERLIRLYPATPYAIQVRPKIAEVELKRKGQSAPPKVADSTAAAPPKISVIEDEEVARGRRAAQERGLPGRKAVVDSTAGKRPAIPEKPLKPEEKD